MSTGLLFVMFVLADSPQLTANAPRVPEVAQASQMRDTNEPPVVSCSCPREDAQVKKGAGPNDNLDLGETARWPAY